MPLVARKDQGKSACFSRLLDNQLHTIVCRFFFIGADDSVRFLEGAMAGSRRMSRMVRTADTLEYLLEVESPDVGPQDKYADDKAGIPDAVGDECLVGRVG